MANFLFDDAVRMYARKAKRNNYKRLTHDVYLYQRGYGDNVFYSVRLFSTYIVDIYPDYQVLNPGGWHTMRTAKEMVEWSAAQSVYLKSGGLRIYHGLLKRGSCPITNNMRIANNGMPFEQDTTSDWVQRVKPEVVRAWKKLTMPLTKNLVGRFALGEFDDVGPDRVGGAHPYDLDVLAKMDPMFPTHDEVAALLLKVSGRVKGSGWGARASLRSPSERWRAVLNELRDRFYLENNGYMQVEVPNV